MPGRHSTRLVIDASVAFGRSEVHPIAKARRDFLRQVLKVCHKIVVTPAGAKEWKRHQSDFAKEWRATMESKRKIVWVQPAINRELRDLIIERAGNEGERREMEKDAHLIEAALATDQTVASADERARRGFAAFVPGLPELRAVVWVNPEKDPKRVLDWLRWSGQDDADWRLGYAP
jgi:hypothetical protein